MKKKGGTVSIIIPTRNRKEYVRRAVKSVLDQDYEPLQVIVVDDASTDGTRNDLMDGFRGDIIYSQNSSPVGANVSRNHGLVLAMGDYLSFLDDDDYYSRFDKVSNQVDLLNQNSNVGFVGCGYYHSAIKQNRTPKIRGKIDKQFLVSFGDIETSTVMMTRETQKKIGYPDARFRSEQNHDFFYRLSKITEFDYLPDVYVIKGTPATKQISRGLINKIQGYTLFHKKYFNDLKKLPPNQFMKAELKFITTFEFLFIAFPE